jgi:hypothetical protein
MKKLAIVAMAALLCIAFVAPSFALENKFGGYWRTRAYTQKNFSGEDDDNGISIVDTRTRLYYTAQINDNLKFVNKFEFDADWGGTGDYGDIGADGVNVEIKNSYVDFSMGDMNFKVGVQGWVLARGFMFDDDFAGAIITYKGDGFKLPFIWVKAYEGDSETTVEDQNDDDVDYFALAPVFHLMDGSLSVNPYILYAYSSYEDTPKNFLKYVNHEELAAWFVGLDLDYSADALGLWFTGIYEGGTYDDLTGEEIDLSAYLVAIGADYDFGGFGLHGQFFYASGDDDAADDDQEAFVAPRGQSHYWSEIMGYGIFDNQVSANAPADFVTDIMAANIGASFKPMDKMKTTLDVWYAAKAEDTTFANGEEEDQLGTEVDLKMSYQLMDNLTLDLVGAYLFAGDATSANGENEEDPYELGARLYIKF